MEHDYNNMADPRQFITGGRSFFPPEFMVAPHLHPHLPYANVLAYRHDPTGITGTGLIAGVGGGGSVMETDISGGGDAGTGRWPRLETLSLLEVRTRLDSKFKEANHQKAPLWDEVSRIMSEEYGYQRSGKKCREKFENLYKYYKKTKEGKSRRQDGKHYRFFRQLEALYGETSKSASEADTSHFHGGGGGNFRQAFGNDDVSLAINQGTPFSAPNNNNNNNLVSPSNCCDSADISSGESDAREEEDDDEEARSGDLKGKKHRKSLKGKIMGFINQQMTKLMEKQEAWMDKVMNTIEVKEQERILREEKWRKQDAARIEREHSFWAGEKAWIEARDNALMEAFHQAAGKQNKYMDFMPGKANGSYNGLIWSDHEVTKLIQLRSGMKFGIDTGISEEAFWEEISRKMGSFGYQRSGFMCKEKWDSLNDYGSKGSKKRKENENPKNGSCYEQIGGSLYCDTSEYQQQSGIGFPMSIGNHSNHNAHWGSGF